MKKFILLIVLVTILAAPFKSVDAQNKKDQVIMNIAGEDIYVSDFLRVYEKNNQSKTIDEDDLKEYIDLYVVYKLKVKEAEAIGLDTIPRFTSELNGYRKQLAKPYLTYSEYDERLMKEAYDHMKYDVRASHILIRLDNNPTISDTLKAYNKIMEIRNRATNGESFEQLAESLSEDPSARDQKSNRGGPDFKGNKGDLGYFSAFDMVYPFEKGAYNTALNSISTPVRTDFGYHLIKVTDKMPAIGKVTVAHILVRVPETADDAEQKRILEKTQEIHVKAKNGQDFAQLAAMYSDDKGSAQKGGELPAFGSNRMVPEFISAISKLSVGGEVSAPVRTSYGWHIIKLVNKTGIKSYEDETKYLKQRIKSDSRGQLSSHYAAQRIKSEFKFKEKKKALKKFYPLVDSTLFTGKWSADKATSLTKKMFKVGDLTVNQSEFAKYIESNQLKDGKGDAVYYINQLYQRFVESTLINYKDSKLEELYPDFKHLMQEYHDGILLFDLTEKMVWNKAITDTVGLKNFYEQNKNNYRWDRRVDAAIYQCSDAKVAEQIQQMLAIGMSSQQIRERLNRDSKLTLFVKEGLFSADDEEVLSKIEWKKGLSEVVQSDQIFKLIDIKEILEPQTKQLKEAKGLITADYQDQLEHNWLESLKSKYNIEVFDVINAVKEYKSN